MPARLEETDGLEITGLTWETPRCDHEWIALEDLRGVLAKHGLTIVPIAEMPSAEERAKADARRLAEEKALNNCAAKGPCRICAAIRARRAAKGEG